jgi:hypothetical protein
VLPLALVLASIAGCASGPAQDPIATLATPGKPGREYLAAMAAADAAPESPEYIQQLRRIVVDPTYVVEARRAAYARLYERHREELKSTLELRLPQLEALEWRRELCGRIAEDGWTQMTPTLIRAWAQFIPGWANLKEERPERAALAKLHGSDRVVDVLLAELRQANPVTQANLRARCWELLLQEGQEARLRELLADPANVSGDGMLTDLRAGVVELGVLPRTREEILWLRSLRSPANAAFWSAARDAVATLPPSARASLELRDLPILVAVRTHRPQYLELDDAALTRLILDRTGGPDRAVISPEFEGYSGDFSERLVVVDKRLTRGDRLAMLIALDAFHSEALRRHLFECGDRDRADRTAEYGGVIDLDERGRFEFIEFPTVTRGNDARYESSQDLMNRLYTSLFHIHLHAQAYDNRKYAGPHMGDFRFADATRANGLVLTFISADRMNLDFYRHDRVVVDLGTIERP